MVATIVLWCITSQLLFNAGCLKAQSCSPEARISCGAKKTSQEECESLGCCWTPSELEPECYFQTPQYVVKSISNTTHGKKVILEAENIGVAKGAGSPISPLVVDFIQETIFRLHVKITDPNNKRWEIPESLLPVPPLPSTPVKNPTLEYELAAEGKEFHFSIFRSYYNISLFNTTSSKLFFGNQFLKIGTSLPPDYSIYGLGEHKTRLRLSPGQTYTLWNSDTPTTENLNLYGSHPFYMQVQGQFVHGVFLRNSNGMDVELGDTSLTYKVTGGILDFYIFGGYFAPETIVATYYELVGGPAMPPYWALGFHQCRWGYKNLQEVKDVVANFSSHNIPLDNVWTDIDYMDKFKDFTTDADNFPSDEMYQFIKLLHSKGQHYVVILDPAISVTQGYSAYEEGVDMDVFIKDSNGKIFIGEVWPGKTAFPDFSYSITQDYWSKQIANFLEAVPVDGFLIDMNEPSNFCNGTCNSSDVDNTSKKPDYSSVPFDPVNPPYSINNHGEKLPLNHKTLDMDTIHHNGEPEYNMHNLYGFTESIATRKALMSVHKGKRPFVLSRSTFAGSGAYAAHWLGDNKATAEDLYYSIPGILNFQMFGVPMVGADICGFEGNTTEELCARWMEVGAFYPFSWNHNSKYASLQEPYLWDSVAAISRKYLSIRYSLLPYYYTLFFLVSRTNDIYYPTTPMVLKPLFFRYDIDPHTLSIDDQFLVGDYLLISPQLKLGEEGRKRDVYFPPDQWYDWYTLDEVTRTGQTTVTINTPLDYVPIHIRTGAIIPMQEPGLTTAESRKNPYSLLVTLGDDGNAAGSIYLDDGETLDTTDFTYVFYSCNNKGRLTSSVSGTKYATKMNLPLLMNVTVLGVKSRPSTVALDGKELQFTFMEGKTFKLMVRNLSINMDTEFNLIWR